MKRLLFALWALSALTTAYADNLVINEVMADRDRRPAETEGAPSAEEPPGPAEPAAQPPAQEPAQNAGPIRERSITGSQKLYIVPPRSCAVFVSGPAPEEEEKA